MAQCLLMLRVAGMPANDEQLLEWLDRPEQAQALMLEYRGAVLPVRHIAFDAIASRFGFEKSPQPDAG